MLAARAFFLIIISFLAAGCGRKATDAFSNSEMESAEGEALVRHVISTLPAIEPAVPKEYCIVTGPRLHSASMKFVRRFGDLDAKFISGDVLSVRKEDDTIISPVTGLPPLTLQILEIKRTGADTCDAVAGWAYKRQWERRKFTLTKSGDSWKVTDGGRIEGGDAPPKVSRLDREKLLLYHKSDGSIAEAKSAEEWKQRRAEIVRGVEEVMGKFPGSEKRCPLDVKVDEEVDCGTHVRRLISYASESGSRTPAYLLIPKSASKDKPVPAVLCLHGTDNVIGHAAIIEGMGGKTNRQYASELAARGFVTIAPNYPLLAKYQPDLKTLGWQSGTMKAIWDNSRALDVLDAMPEVKHGAYGAIGHSLGGHNSIYTAFFDERIKAVVSSCGFDSYLDYMGGDSKRWEPGQGWCQDRYMAKMADYKGKLPEIPFDFHELVGSLAPRPMFVNAPLKDANFKWESVDRVINAARQVYALHGAADVLVVEHPDCNHDFPPEMREKGYALFEKVLK